MGSCRFPQFPISRVPEFQISHKSGSLDVMNHMFGDLEFRK